MENGELIHSLEQIVCDIKALIQNNSWDMNIIEHKNKWDEMVNNAIELHKKINPKHHKYMIENRGCSPDEPEFYNHIHPVEDLIAYAYDPHANDDPEDQTIGDKFEVQIYSRRWGHVDSYTVIRNEKGWTISHFGTGGQSDKTGNPYLFKILNHDSINFPEELPGYMEWLWQRAEEDGLTHEEVQDALNELTTWINLCEQNSPRGIWKGFK